jgi:hypothetical protein
LNGETNRARQRQNSAIIVADVRRFAHVINTDGVLGTYNQRTWGGIVKKLGLRAE